MLLLPTRYPCTLKPIWEFPKNGDPNIVPYKVGSVFLDPKSGTPNFWKLPFRALSIKPEAAAHLPRPAEQEQQQMREENQGGKPYLRRFRA